MRIITESIKKNQTAFRVLWYPGKTSRLFMVEHTFPTENIMPWLRKIQSITSDPSTLEKSLDWFVQNTNGMIPVAVDFWLHFIDGHEDWSYAVAGSVLHQAILSGGKTTKAKAQEKNISWDGGIIHAPREIHTAIRCVRAGREFPAEIKIWLKKNIDAELQKRQHLELLPEIQSVLIRAGT